MPPFRRSGHHLLTLLTAAFLAVGQLTAHLHLVFEAHELCLEHGEFVHADGDPAAFAHEHEHEHEHEQVPGEDEPAGHGEDGHEHCSVVHLFERPADVPAVASHCSAPFLFPARPAASPPTTPYVDEVSWLLAPKNSPPA